MKTGLFIYLEQEPLVLYIRTEAVSNFPVRPSSNITSY